MPSNHETHIYEIDQHDFDISSFDKYTMNEKESEESGLIEEHEYVAANISIDAVGASAEIINTDDELARVDHELKRYTCQANNADYAFAILSGLMAGAIDVLFVGETKITEKDNVLSNTQINKFIEKYAKDKGLDRARLKDAISALEGKFEVDQDVVWKGKNIGVSAKNHHLADLAHHPTPLGLVSAIVVQFLRVGTFVNKAGKWHFIPVKTTLSDFIRIWAPAIITGILNWLVAIATNKYEEESGQEVPKALHRAVHLVASTPIIIEVAKCADNWFGHLVSDMGGSKNTPGQGMGIPGVFLSLLHELSGLPILKDSGLPAYVNDLYVKKKMDLRHEFAYDKAAVKQAIPIVFNELFVRTGFFVTRLAVEITEHQGLKGIEWSNVVPLHNRTVERMLTVASMTFTVADSADAAVHAALESAGNWVLFAGRFVIRFNYVGAGRAAIAIVREILSDKKEAQLLHEKRILTSVKTGFVIQELEEYKAQLDELLSNYIAEDVEAFITGFNYMNQGLESGDSDLVIKGNVVIQRVLGRKPQFTSQEEFDDLMDSEKPLIL